MFVGKVIGTVWSTVKWPETRGLKLLLVRPYHLGDLLAREDGSQSAQATKPPQSGSNAHLDGEAVVCADLLDAGVGDDVVVAFGHAARVAAQETGASAAASSSPTSRPSWRPTSESSSGSRGSAPSPSGAPTVAPIDAAIVAIVDRIGLARPGT